MTILIIEDDAQLRQILVEKLEVVLRRQGGVGAIRESPLRPARTFNGAKREWDQVVAAGDLEGALALLPHADAVLSDGTFPGADGGRPKKDNWLTIFGKCTKTKKRFVLLSGDLDLVLAARKIGIEAFAKPEGANDAIACVLDGKEKAEGSRQ